MECLIDRRKKDIEETFQAHKHDIQLPKLEERLKLEYKFKLIKNYMPKEPEMDSYVYTVNIGNKANDPDSKRVEDENGVKTLLSVLYTEDELEKNPNITIQYNVKKYLNAFNKKVKSLLVGFDDKVAKKIIAKYAKVKVVGIDGKKTTQEILVKNNGLFESSEYELKSFELDNVEESMVLERKEVDFWNRYGYNPNLVWDEFKTEDSLKMTIRNDVYVDALNYLNNKMIEANKPLIKSLDDNIFENDMVLIKNKFHYSLGLYNGEYFKIIRDNIEIPKSQYQTDLEIAEKMEIEAINNIVNKAKKKKETKAVKIKEATLFDNIEEVNVEEVDVEDEPDKLVKESKKHSKHLKEFLKRFNVEEDITLDMIYSDDEAKRIFEEYVKDTENDDEDDYFDEDLDLDS